ncbi:hypothetical protein RHGRI_038075 [Rhododendron griersonianum]|uniref:Assimilatory sulfite reductase (ferredoxin) n=1 Tax=Rhododendron griersonianum TaxID=479676 RepID=A0AAV6HYG8_9ERIC|nr:hypothetical protein RHGRI_038075 [Rhododendron griersonianum]
MGNCCVAPSGSSSEKKKEKRKKPNPFAIDYGATKASGSGNKSTVLKDPTGDDISQQYNLGRELGRGEFGITYLAIDVETGEKYACKSISKKKLRTAVDIEDVRREVEIMKHLPKHLNVVSLKDTYEDDNAVHIVMELCEGGELFDRIVARGHYTERAAAAVMRTIVEVVQACHRQGVIHRDLKPENFLFANKKETAALKAIDFGLSIFFKPGERFTEIVGSPYYMAPEVLKRNYGPEIDVWSAGVILYILLCGVPPFWAETEQGVAQAIIRSVIDFKRDPWPKVSDNAKDLVKRMLDPDPNKRLTALEVLGNVSFQKLVIAEHLSVEEVAGIKEAFDKMDINKRGKINLEELRIGLQKIGHQIPDADLQILMQAADVDGDGTLNYGEFVAVSVHLRKMANDEHLHKAFAFFDLNQSGYIEIEELRDALRDEDDTNNEEVINAIMHDVDTDKPVKPGTSAEPKRSKVEIFKEQSNFIRYPLNEELLTDAPNINEPATQLIKFHGSYQQTNRDERGSKSYSFMLRTKNPCGKVSNELYLAMDDLADQFGIGTLRLTTRQTFQLHGVLKKDLKTVMSTIIRNMGSTLGACGDLNRNVLAPAAPLARKDYLFAQETAENIAALLTPQSGFYYDMWVDGERIMSAEPPEVVKARNDNSHGTNFPDSPEPIYGTQFLPRKFKVAVTVPTDNSVDILTNDIGVVVGGGMGRTHRVETTFPRLAEPLGYVPKEDILYAVKAIVVTQRENGRRDDRKYSRMKYLLSSWGIEKFRTVVEQYYGRKFEPCRELPEWEFKSYLGWHEQGDGRLFCGLNVDNGRIKGTMKKTLREVIEKYKLNVRITPNQNLVLCGIRRAWKRPITTTLAQVGLLDPRFVDPLNITAMACPALPLCPLAITEAERGIPDILKRVRSVFDKVGLKYNEAIVIRITGCPNGCARPYMAELGFVGDGPNSYQVTCRLMLMNSNAIGFENSSPQVGDGEIKLNVFVHVLNQLWLGGTPNQMSLAKCFMNKVKIQELEKVMEPLFYYWKKQRQSRESFGDFTNRLGFEKLQEYVDKWEGLPDSSNRYNLKVFTDRETYNRVDELAKLQDKTAHQLAMDVIRNFVASQENGKSE